jgi:putative nucleotidyltransferase with HDIG domain
MGFLPNQVEWMRTASILHDIGKITVPIEILSKPGRLSDSEFGIVRTHPQVGYEILKKVTFPWPVAQVVLQHHEHLDGTGYPNGLRGDAVLPEARILTVADVIEAMSSHRPYRPAHDFSKVLEEVRWFRGTRYDAAVVDSCMKVFFDRGFRFEDAELAQRNVL